jgi:hypothetical protein
MLSLIHSLGCKQVMSDRALEVGSLVKPAGFIAIVDVCYSQLVILIALVILNIGSAHCLTAKWLPDP